MVSSLPFGLEKRDGFGGRIWKQRDFTKLDGLALNFHWNRDVIGSGRFLQWEEEGTNFWIVKG